MSWRATSSRPNGRTVGRAHLYREREHGSGLSQPFTLPFSSGNYTLWLSGFLPGVSCPNCLRSPSIILRIFDVGFRVLSLGSGRWGCKFQNFSPCAHAYQIRNSICLGEGTSSSKHRTCRTGTCALQLQGCIPCVCVSSMLIDK